MSSVHPDHHDLAGRAVDTNDALDQGSLFNALRATVVRRGVAYQDAPRSSAVQVLRHASGRRGRGRLRDAAVAAGSASAPRS